MFVVVPRLDRLRLVVECEIQRLYRERYGASVVSFAPTLVAELSERGDVRCAAGIRFAHERLFLECYLDRPIEQVLEGNVCVRVERERIVEVCHLAGAGSGCSSAFVRKLIALLRGMNAEWAIFTATKPLRHLLIRSGLSMIELAKADARCVRRPETWGSYYENDPRIMAISGHCTSREATQAIHNSTSRAASDACVL